MKRLVPVIAEGRGIWLKSGSLRFTLSHYTTNYSWLCFPGVRSNLWNFWTCSKRYNSLRFPAMHRFVTNGIQRVSHYTILIWRWRRGGPSQVVSSKSCSVRPALFMTSSQYTLFLTQKGQNQTKLLASISYWGSEGSFSCWRISL